MSNQILFALVPLTFAVGAIAQEPRGGRTERGTEPQGTERQDPSNRQGQDPTKQGQDPSKQGQDPRSGERRPGTGNGNGAGKTGQPADASGRGGQMMLENTTWVVMLAPDSEAEKKGEKPYSDKLTFKNNKIESESGSKKGFEPTSYTVAKQGENWVLRAEQKSGSQTKAVWVGEIAGQSLRGTMTLTDDKGEPKKYNFTGEREVPGAGTGRTPGQGGTDPAGRGGKDPATDPTRRGGTDPATDPTRRGGTDPARRGGSAPAKDPARGGGPEPGRQPAGGGTDPRR